MWSSGVRAMRLLLAVLGACFAVVFLPSASWADTSTPSPTVSDTATPSVEPSATPSTSEPSSSPSPSSTSDPSATPSPTDSSVSPCGDSAHPCVVTFEGVTAAFMMLAAGATLFLLSALLVSAWGRG